MGAGASVLLAVTQAAHAAEILPCPKVGSCADCIGEVETTLNVCPESAASCVSTQNDDEAHFLPPWSYDGTRDAAVDRLIRVATGGSYSQIPSNEPLGISRSSAAAYIVSGVANVIQGKPPPEKPERAPGRDGQPFDGVLADRHTTGEGAEYVRLTFGTAGGAATEVDDPSSVIDAEFLFLADDNIVVLRAASRAEPQRGQGSLSLNFSKGIVFDANAAGRLLERLRKALSFEVTPVITDFDPRFNGSKPLWFERLYKPFLQGRYGSDQQGDDQSERPLVDGRRV